jgi:hypothetical protein
VRGAVGWSQFGAGGREGRADAVGD